MGVYCDSPESFRQGVRALSLGAASAQTQVVAPARRKTLRGRPGRSELRLALTRLRFKLRCAVPKLKLGRSREGVQGNALTWLYRTPLGLPEGAFCGVVWTLVILARGAMSIAARWCTCDVIWLTLPASGAAQ